MKKTTKRTKANEAAANVMREARRAQKDAAAELPRLTKLEGDLLINIAENTYAPLNGGEPTSFDDVASVWSAHLDDGPISIAKRSIPGIAAGLVKKGLAATGGSPTGKEATIALTKLGFAAYRRVKAERTATGVAAPAARAPKKRGGKLVGHIDMGTGTFIDADAPAPRASKIAAAPAPAPAAEPAARTWAEVYAERVAARKAAEAKAKGRKRRAPAVVEVAYEKLSRHQRAIVDWYAARAAKGDVSSTRAGVIIPELPADLRDGFYVRWGLSQLVRTGWLKRLDRGVYGVGDATLARVKAQGKAARKPAGKATRKAAKLDGASRRLDRRVAARRAAKTKAAAR